jgi:hypothetical protein
VYPSFDYYFIDAGSLVGFSVDLKLNSLPWRNPFYLGGGLNFLRRGNGASDTDTGGDFFIGVEGRRGLNHPYLELRLLLHDDTSLQLAAGLNFTLF